MGAWRAPRFVLLLALAWLGACARGGEREAEADRAVEACLSGMTAVADQPPFERAPALARACQGLFREDGCRQAWGRLGQVSPDLRAAALVEACRQAYCPLLAEPRPALCAAAEVPAGMEARAEAWRALLRAILERDLGPERAARLQAGLALLSSAYEVYPVRLPVAEEPEAGVLRLEVRVGPERTLVSMVRGDKVLRRLELPTRPGPADFGPVRDAVRAAGGTGGQVVLSVAPEVVYARVVEVMDGLREVGFGDVLLSVDEGGGGGKE